MKKVRVGGVPEHFNLAWHMAIEKGTFAQNNIEIEWVDVPGGTGAMCKALREGTLDIAIALTEGIVKDIAEGNPSKVAQFYVNSPLRWGIFVNANSSITNIDQMPGQKYAISRFGSGSHLMACVNASNHGFSVKQEDFVVVKDLAGARKAIADNTAQLFMWEKYTTRPYVENGEFRMIGECNTPWPCFVVAASDSFINKEANTLTRVLNIVNHSCRLMINNPQAPLLVAQRYGISEDSARQWFRELEYACHLEMAEAELRLILWRLQKFGIIEQVPDLKEVIITSNLEPADALMLE
jgi:ABC-type nitrate/sulfonate/bicarbonate transport system substrate-binding protein